MSHAKPARSDCTLELKVIPNAPRNEVAGWLGSTLKVKIRAPALEGRANDELLAFLATELGLPPRALTLRLGHRTRRKVVAVASLTSGEVRRRLNQPDLP